MIRRFEGLVRSPLGRILGGLVGLACLVVLVRRSGPDAVLAAVTRAPALFPLVVLLEAAVASCDVVGLYFLYGADRRKVPATQWVRSGLISFAVMSVVPMGRAVAEATRAAMLSRYIGASRAAAAAARMQAVALLANACISLPCTLAAFALVGATWFPAVVLLNFLVTAALGGGVLLAGRHVGVGQWLGQRFKRGEGWGADFDRHLRTDELVPLGAVASVFVGRSLQTTQRMVLLAAVGASVGLLKGLCAEGVHLVSGSIGDMVPGQLGVTEALYSFTSSVLQLTPSDGVAIALLAHMAQLIWLGVGSLTPLVWPPPKVTA